MRLLRYVGRRAARRSCIRTSSTRTRTGRWPALWRPCPVRVSTKHGFNEFREGRAFALADRGVASLAHVHIAISRGLAQYLAETEGFDADDFEIVHYGIAPRGDPPPYAGVDAPSPLRRPADPDQGPHRPAAGLRRGAKGGARPDTGHRRSRAARAGAEGARPRARRRRRGPLRRLRVADPATRSKRRR